MNKKIINALIFIFIVCILTINVQADEVVSCTQVFDQKLIDEINDIFRVIRIVAPIILLILTSIDFAKIVFSDNKDGMSKAKNNFLKRAVAVLIIFFAPNIIEIILSLVNSVSMDQCLKALGNK